MVCWVGYRHHAECKPSSLTSYWTQCKQDGNRRYILLTSPLITSSLAPLSSLLSSTPIAELQQQLGPVLCSQRPKGSLSVPCSSSEQSYTQGSPTHLTTGCGANCFRWYSVFLQSDVLLLLLKVKVRTGSLMVLGSPWHHSCMFSKYFCSVRCQGDLMSRESAITRLSVSNTSLSRVVVVPALSSSPVPTGLWRQYPATFRYRLCRALACTLRMDTYIPPKRW
jgi:hypothetical protein